MYEECHSEGDHSALSFLAALAAWRENHLLIGFILFIAGGHHPCTRNSLRDKEEQPCVSK